MRCSVGDDCFVINSRWPVNIGRIVTIVAHATYPGTDWATRSKGSVLTGKCEMTGDVRQSMRMSFRDAQLLPIKAEPEDVLDIVKELTLERG
jgi:hypothetical protein